MYAYGELHGIWLNATHPLHTLRQQVREMLKTSPVPQAAADIAIHRAGEHESRDSVHEIACFLRDHPELSEGLLGES